MAPPFSGTRGLSAAQALVELRAILENATVGILFTSNRTVTQANPLCAQMFGYGNDEFVGLPGEKLYPGIDAYDGVGRDAGPVLAAGQPYQTECQMRRKDGGLFWCRMSAKAIDSAHPQNGTIWIMEDVSVDRMMREALENSMAELGAIFEAALMGIVVARERTIARCNPRFEELLGHGAGELLGKPVQIIYAGVSNFDEVHRHANEAQDAGTDSATDAGPPPLGTAVGVATGVDHSCALFESGRVLCWGADERGQLGDAMTRLAGMPRTSPIEVVGLPAPVVAMRCSTGMPSSSSK